MAVVVTVAKGYDLGYVWKTQGEAAGRAMGGYYLNAAQAGEPPGRWWGPGASALGLTPGQVVQRGPYEAVFRAAAEADTARKAGDHDRAAQQDTLAASYHALGELYRQREQTLAQAMADRQDWEQATAEHDMEPEAAG